MDQHINFLQYFVDKGGPCIEDFYGLDAWIAEIAESARKGKLTSGDIKRLRVDVLGDAFSVETMQGFAFQKPHGYAGDFEISDRIYQKYTSNKPHLTEWDIIWQDHAATHAVRNRVEYFYQQLSRSQFSTQISERGAGAEILNLACGPGRNMLKHLTLETAAEFGQKP
jgi:hypothetical protein